MSILIDADKVSMRRPGRPLFVDASITVSTGDRIGVVGLNGAGKSTLIRVLTGRVEPESGSVRVGRGVRMAMLDQRPDLGEGTVREAVGAGWEGEAVLDRLGLGARLDDVVTTLSGGDSKRVALARTLVEPADLLVLDEPTNHLDIDGIAWLESHLETFKGGLILVTHDRHLLDRVTTRVVEVDRGDIFVHDGGYGAYLEAKAAREAAAAEAETKRRNLARQELAWLRRGAPARTRKAKARIRSATELIDDGPRAAARAGELDLHFGTPRLGDQIIDVEGVTFGYDDEAVLLQAVTLLLHRRERLGIVGVNGSGKSTLLDLMAGRLQPDEGSITVGPTVSLSYYDQVGRSLDPSRRVRDVVAGDGEPDWRDARLLEQFWFDSDSQFAPVELLSGGEQRRLQLVMTLAEQPNVLFLDEPTNDLDLDTLRSLEDFLEDFPGALVVVSHDRAFLERTVDDVVILDGSGLVARKPGGYEAWEAERRTARSAPRKPAPARVPASPAEPTEAAPSPSTLRFRMKDLERSMRPLEKKRDELMAALDSATGDHEGLARVGSALTEVQESLGAMEEEWLELGEALEERRHG
ncbi:MAG: ABC-F family ATP-binding cassette domain-containing protein [Acidimicrobiales bacterium]